MLNIACRRSTVVINRVKIDHHYVIAMLMMINESGSKRLGIMMKKVQIPHSLGQYHHSHAWHDHSVSPRDPSGAQRSCLVSAQ